MGVWSEPVLSARVLSRTARTLWPGAEGEVEDLGNLAAGGRIAGVEAAVSVAVEQPVAVCRLNVAVEDVARRHVAEVRCACVVQRYSHAEDSSTFANCPRVTGAFGR